MKLPSYIIAALRKGLELHKAGKSGDGLVPATVAMATRGVSSGEWPDEKIVRASAWFARHIGDRQRMKNPRAWDDAPDYSPAYVAWLLWGSDSDGRGRNWIDNQAKKIKESIMDEKEIGPIAVTVQKGSDGNVYAFDGKQKDIVFGVPGDVVKFDVSDSSNKNHPLRFSRTNDGTHGGGEAIQSAAKRQGQPGEPGSTITLELTRDMPEVLYYYCANHAGMGASIKVMRRKSEAPGDRISSTPAPPEDRIKGGRNTGRAGGKARAPIVLGRATNAALRRKIKDHNAEVEDAPSKRATLPMLQKVYLRGAGAFSTSHRPGMTRSQWALARVNAFLYLLKNGRPKDPKYITDNDLLPSSHPKASKKKESIGEGSMKREAYGRMLASLVYEMGSMLKAIEGKKEEGMYKDLMDAHLMMKGMDVYGDDTRGMMHKALGAMCNCHRKMVVYVMPAQQSQAATDVQIDDGEMLVVGEMMKKMEGLIQRYESEIAQMTNEYHHDEEENREAVEEPTMAQRRDLPAAAFMPTAFMQDGEFLRSKSKLPHHINTASDPDDNQTVDVPRLRNALARFNQTDFSEFPDGTRERSRAHLERHADALLYQAKEGGCKQCSQEELDALRDALKKLRG